MKSDSNKQTNTKNQSKKKMPGWLKWGIIVFIISLFLSALFSLITELCITEKSPWFICVIVMIVLLLLNISCDVIANAIISCKADSFNAMASHKISGAKRAVLFCKNQEKLASIFADVIGDICGIISGAASAALVAHLVMRGDATMEIIMSVVVSAIIGALTVGGKALFKPFAVKYNRSIVLIVAKCTTLFVKEK